MFDQEKLTTYAYFEFLFTAAKLNFELNNSLKKYIFIDTKHKQNFNQGNYFESFAQVNCRKIKKSVY